MKKLSIAVFLLATLSSSLLNAASILAPLNTSSEYWIPMNMVEASDGNFYGTSSATTKATGALSHFIFKLEKNGTHTKLYSFPGSSYIASGGTQNTDVKHTLVEGNDGYLYGVTTNGGANDGGVLYRISKAGAYEVLKTFDAACFSSSCTSTVGSSPYFIWKEGNAVYGVSMNGGFYKLGTIFKYEAGVFSILRHFTNTPASGSSVPQALYLGHLLAKNGNDFYAYKAPAHTYSVVNVNGGVLSKVTIQSGSQYSVQPLHTFSARTGTVTAGNGFTNLDGSHVKWLHVMSSGKIYGESIYEGANGYGTVFKIEGGALSIIRHNSIRDNGESLVTSRGSPAQETSSGSLLIRGTFSLIELTDAGLSVKEAACPDCFVVRGSDKKGYGFARANQSLTDSNYAYKWGATGSFYTVDLPDLPPVEPEVVPELTFTYSPVPIVNGETVTLTWSSTNADSCEATSAWTGAKALSGSIIFAATEGEKTYVLTCYAGQASVVKSVTIGFTTPPVDPEEPIDPEEPVDPENPPSSSGGSGGGSFSFFGLFLLAGLLFIRKFKKV